MMEESESLPSGGWCSPGGQKTGGQSQCQVPLKGDRILQSILPKLTPKIFSPDNEVTDDIMSVTECLKTNSLQLALARFIG